MPELDFDLDFEPKTLIPKTPKQDVEFESNLLDWIEAGFPLGGVGKPTKKRKIAVSPQVSNVLSSYEKWTKTPFGKYLTGGGEEEIPPIQRHIATTGAIVIGAQALKSLLSDPLISSKISSFTARNIVTKNLSSPQQLAERILAGQGRAEVLRGVLPSKKGIVFNLLRQATGAKTHIAGLLPFRPSPQAGFARIPSGKELQEIASKLGLTSSQVELVRSGQIQALPPAIVGELSKLGFVPEQIELKGFKEGEGFVTQPTTKEFKKAYREQPEIKAKIETQRLFQPQKLKKDIEKALFAQPEIKGQIKGKAVFDRVEKQLAKQPAKPKPLIRQVTGQFTPVEPTIKEPQALRHLLKREEQVARKAGQVTKKETKETLKLIRQIKNSPIEGMVFEDRNKIEELVKQTKRVRTLKELRTLYDEVSKIKAEGKLKYIQTKEIKQKQFKVEKDILLKTIGATIEPPKPRGLIGEEKKPFLLPKLVRATTLRPMRIFDGFDGGQNFEGPNNQYFYIRANKAEDIKLKAIFSRTDTMTSAMKEIGITEKDLLQTRPINGVKFTVDEMLSIYTGSKNLEKTLAIVYGNKIPFKLMRDVIAQMSSQEKAMGEAIIKEYEASYPSLRKSFIEYMDGKQDLGRVSGGYTPIRRTMNGYIPTEDELIEELTTRSNLKKAYANRDFTKGRVKIPKQYQQPIKMGELSIWMEQMAKQEHFKAYGGLIKEMHKMSREPDFMKAITSKFGKPYLDATENWINRVANPSIYKSFSQMEKTVSMMRQNAAIAYLGVNLVTMLKQAPSLALFLEDVNGSQLLAGIYDLTTDYKTKLKMIHELAPQMRNRSIERELEEFKTRDPNKYRQMVKKFGQKAMVGIYEIDKLVTHSGWLAVFNKYARLGLSEVEAADRATRAVLRTQPAAHAKDIAEIYATSEFLNIFLQFSNQLNQIYNIITYDIPAQARTRRYRDAIRTASGVVLSAYLIYWMAKGKPPKTKEELLEATFEQGTSYIPMFGRGFTSKEKGFSFISVPAFGSFEALSETITAIKKGKPGKVFAKGAEAITVGFGIPFAQPRRLIRAVKGKDVRQLLHTKKRGTQIATEDELGLDLDLDLDFDLDF